MESVPDPLKLYTFPFREDIWIGLDDRGSEDSFQWTDGSTFSWIDWGRKWSKYTIFQNKRKMDSLIFPGAQGQCPSHVELMT